MNAIVKDEQLAYTGRQAILDRRQRTVAYELLFRDSLENRFPNIDPHKATGSIISDTHLVNGLSQVTGGKIALINFTERCLLGGFADMLDRKKVIIEIVEDVQPSDEVFEVMRDLFHRGYVMALDDFVYRPEWRRFFKFVKIIKFDIERTPLDRIAPLVKQLQKRPNLRLLAERVETKEQFEQAMDMGFDFFQGYFFCKPEIRTTRKIEASYARLIELYYELNKPTINMNKVERCFEGDVVLTFKLLKYVNGGAFSLVSKLSSIKGALVYLGEIEVRKLIALLTTGLVKNKPKELVRMAIVRARTCEQACRKEYPAVAEEAFLVGLLSLLPSMLDRSMEDILDELPVTDTIKESLLDEKEQTPLRIVYNATLFIESGSWHLTTKECKKLHRLDYEGLRQIYQEAIVWAQDVEASDDVVERTGDLIDVMRR
jgi:c-di-GMP phosphodiesterase